MPHFVVFRPHWFAAALLISVVAGGLAVSRCHAVETIIAKTDESSDSERQIIGEVLVEAQDGGVMLRADDGRIWTIQPDQIVSRKSDDSELVPIDDKEMARRMLAELPAGFRAYRTANFLILHNGSDAYVRRVGALFEQLFKGFNAYWKNQGWKLPEPRFPLTALVLADHASFLDHATAEIGEMAKSVIGYYHLETNCMTTFNVPNLERNIATIVHEATHQLAYNTGIQKRYSDNPMWVSEGLALYFESPDFSNPRTGWRSIGRVNRVNFNRWKNYLRSRPADSLTTLLADDSRFRSSATAEFAYAEAWALTFFLLKTKRQQYVSYMRTLSEGKPLAKNTPRERIEMFEQAFGASLADLDRQMVHYISRLK